MASFCGRRFGERVSGNEECDVSCQLLQERNHSAAVIVPHYLIIDLVSTVMGGGGGGGGDELYISIFIHCGNSK